MDDSAETPEVNNQNATVPCEAASEDGEKRSIADRVKGFFKDERVITAAAAVVAAGLVVALAKGQYAHEDTEDFEPFPDSGAADFEPSPDLEAEDRRERSSPVPHKASGAR
ncbi:hypothetical protein [Streptomyces sp. NPDC001978]|uniref:hypothetical protein n=1 Tax=Streptomyces sp. NPDC001978 TaxID=3364627 RepID=UPI0036BE880B